MREEILDVLKFKAVFIIKIAVDIFIESINKMLDSSCDEETIKKI